MRSTFFIFSTLLSLFTLTGNAQISITDGLISYYPFTGNAGDSSGYGNHGTVVNATLTTDRFGNPDKAYLFNGTSSYISIPATILTNANYTFSMWFNPSNLNSSTLIAVGVGGPDQGIQIVNGYYWGGGGYNSDGTVTGARSTDFPDINAWYHIALTRDNNYIRFYVNGILKVSASTNGLLPSYGSGTKTATIGAREPGTNLFFKGKIDEVGIYNRALSDEEILRLYYIPKGLVGFYQFNTDASDSSGYRNDGVVFGAALVEYQRCGQSNKAYYFNGLYSYIWLPPFYFQGLEYTYAMWVKPATLNTSTLICIGSGGPDQGIQIVDGYYWGGGGYNSNGTVTTATTAEFPFIDNWYHIVITRDRNNIKFYINGILKANSSTSGLLPNYGPGPMSAVLGARQPGNKEYFAGMLDEVRIYDKAISAKEVYDIYNSSCIATSTLQSASLPQEAVTVQPNPSQGSFTLKTEHLTNVEVIVQNATGKTVNSFSFSDFRGEKLLDLTGNAAGLYFMTVKCTEGVTTKKLVINR